MSADNLITLLVELFCLFLGVITTLEFFQQHNPIRRDIALMFGSLAIPATGNLIDRFVNLPNGLADLLLLPLIAQPYLLIRLTNYLQPVPMVVQSLALGGMLFSGVSYLLFQSALPPPIRFLITAYFVIIGSYTMSAFIHGARTASGVVRQRLRFAAVGVGMLALALGFTGVAAFIPVFRTSITLLFAGVAVLCLYVGFAPPRWLRTVWQFAELRKFLTRTSQPTHLLNELCLAATQATGGKIAAVFEKYSETWHRIASDSGAIVDSTGIADNGIISQTWAKKSPALYQTAALTPADRHLLDFAPAETLITVPILNDHPMRVLLVFFEHTSLFPEDDMELLRLLAQQGAVFLENIQLVEQLVTYSEVLELKIQERTEALSASEERFRSIFEQAAVGIAEVSLDDVFLQANHRFCEMLGYSEDELRSLTVHEITHPDDLQTMLSNRAALVSGKTSRYSVEKRFYHKSGYIIWGNVSVSLTRDSSSAPRYYVLAVENITERKRAESAHQKSETRFARVLNTTAEAVISIDADQKIVLFNQSAERIFGYTAAEVLGQSLDRLLPANVIGHHQRFIQEFAEGADISRGMGQRHRDLSAKHKSGTIFPIEASISKLTEGDEVILTVFIRDVTEQRLIETRFARVLNTTAEAVITIDADQKILLFNQSAERIFGYTAAEILGHSLEALLPANVIGHHQRFIQEFAEGADISRGMGQRHRDLSAKHKSGTIFPIEASISKLTEGDEVILTVFIRDVTDQKQAEAALRESESRYHRIIDNMLEGFQIIDFDWRYTYINAAAAEYGRQTSEALVGYTVMEKYPGIESTEMFAAMQRCMESRTVQHAEFPFIYPDGSEAWFQFSIQPVPEGISILSLDITERKRTEAALRESEARFRKAIIEAPIPILIHNEDDEVLEVSNGWTKYSGYNIADIPTMGHWTERAYGERKDSVKEYIDELFTINQTVSNGEWLINTKDRHQRTWDFYTTPLMFSPNGKRELLTIATDITERKLAEDALLKMNEALEQLVAERTKQLRQSEAKFATAFRVSPAAISIATLPDGRWIEINDALVNMTGYSRDELIGHTSLELGLVDSETSAKLLEVIRAKGALRDVEIQLHTRSGESIEVLVSVEQIELDGQLCSLSIQYDITELKRAEREVRRLNADLEQRQVALQAVNKELEAFSYSVSHDLRAPLRALDGFSQALLEDYLDKLDEEGQEYLTLIRMESQRMGQLIDDLLNLARLTRTALKRNEVNLSQIAHEIAKVFQSQNPQREVEFVIEDNLWAWVDPGLIRVALQNLLGNAWKYTGTQSTARIEFGSVRDAHEITYFVRDNGVGFDMNYVHKLFGAFQRLHGVTEFEGTGIGLATVQRIIHQHGGAVRAEGVVNQGAVFYFTLGQKDGNQNEYDSDGRG